MPYSPSTVRIRAARHRPRAAALVAAAVAALAAALSLPVRALPGQLEVDFVANGTSMRCAAADVEFQRTTVTQVAWRCLGSGTRFRCSMTGAGAFATDVDVVALNCNALTEVPFSSPPTLIRASGFEST
jgi:ABC-type taurine transport system substrate-binding protein